MISENPEWVPLSKSEVEETIVKLGKDGVLSARIGLIMRDQYAVPDVKLATGKTVTQILKENDLAPNLPDDLVALMRTAINLQVHLNANKKDVASTLAYFQQNGSILSPMLNYSLSEGNGPGCPNTPQTPFIYFSC